MRKNADLSPSKMVMNVMNDLRGKNGTSLSEIIRYASLKYGMSEETLKVPMELALKRGVKYNIVKVKNGLYRLKKPFFNPFDVFSLSKTGRNEKKLKLMEGYLGKRSKGCRRRGPGKKIRKANKKKVSIAIKEKGRSAKKASRCRWCKKMIQKKGKQTSSAKMKGKVQRRPMKKSSKRS